jgi:hypothetical protein
VSQDLVTVFCLCNFGHELAAVHGYVAAVIQRLLRLCQVDAECRQEIDRVAARLVQLVDDALDREADFVALGAIDQGLIKLFERFRVAGKQLALPRLFDLLADIIVCGPGPAYCPSSYKLEQSAA